MYNAGTVGVVPPCKNYLRPRRGAFCTFRRPDDGLRLAFAGAFRFAVDVLPFCAGRFFAAPFGAAFVRPRAFRFACAGRFVCAGRFAGTFPDFSDAMRFNALPALNHPIWFSLNV